MAYARAHHEEPVVAVVGAVKVVVAEGQVRGERTLHDEAIAILAAELPATVQAGA